MNQMCLQQLGYDFEKTFLLYGYRRCLAATLFRTICYLIYIEHIDVGVKKKRKGNGATDRVERAVRGVWKVTLSGGCNQKETLSRLELLVLRAGSIHKDGASAFYVREDRHRPYRRKVLLKSYPSCCSARVVACLHKNKHFKHKRPLMIEDCHGKSSTMRT